MLFSVAVLAVSVCMVGGAPSPFQSVTVPPTGKAYFTSLTYPRNYARNTNATYIVSGPAGFGILFDSVDFQLCSIKCGYGCFADYVKFSEVLNGELVDISSALCGTITGPLRIASQTNDVTVTFVTGSYGPTYRGFNISATALTGVNTTITVPISGPVYITSPNYPVANYFPSRDIIYFINGPDGYKIEFNTVDFEVQGLNIYGGLFDFLNFAEDSKQGQTVLIGGTPFYGNNGPRKIRSSTNYVTAFFRSDEYLSLRGFNISARLVR